MNDTILQVQYGGGLEKGMLNGKVSWKKENIDVKKTEARKSEIINPVTFSNPFISFRYAYRSIYSDTEKTYIKAKESRFENGRFESEEFEGTMDQSVYDQMVKGMQQFITKQMELLLNPLSFFLPSSKNDKGK